MKLRIIGRAAWAGAVSTGLVAGMAACGARSNTIDYVFVANANGGTGQIDVYKVDGPSGVLGKFSGSPYAAGKNPVSLATTPNNTTLYVANHDDGTIISYTIGSDAALTKANTYNTPGRNPTSIKINAAGTFLYVLDAFAPPYTPDTPGPGALVVYPVNADGTLGTPQTDTATGTPYYPVCNNPVDLTVLNNGADVYVVNDPAGQPPKLVETAGSVASGGIGSGIIAYTATGACSANSGQISGFNVGSSGTLTAIPGSPFAAGTTPTAIASDPTDRFVYVTDLVTNQLIGYTAASGGELLPMNSGPFPTGVYPDAITVDPRGIYIYVANYNAQSVSAYQITQNTGVPSLLSGGSSGYGVTAGPTFVYIEPNAGKYVYTSDFIDSSLYGLQLNPNTGVLTALANDPYGPAIQPMAIAGVTHGNHPTEVLPAF